MIDIEGAACIHFALSTQLYPWIDSCKELSSALPTGEVTGKSTAQTILVSGKMNQSTTAMQSLVVDATGVITGEIAYGDLEIRRGGELLGSITQIKNQSKLTK
jgi:cytoskeletal protein CcmA (bactofilin family)